MSVVCILTGCFRSEPLVKQLAGGWEKCFARRLPNVLSAYSKSSSSLLKDFHRDADDRARKNGVSVAGLHVLKEQLHVYEAIFKDLGTEMVESINSALSLQTSYDSY